MSEPISPTPSPAPTDSTTTSSSTKKKRRTWRQRLIRVLVVIIVLGLTLRIATFYALGPLLRKVGATYGVDVTFDRRDFTFVAGDVGLWGLKISPKNGGEPFFSCGYLRGYLSVWDLVKGRLHVLRAEADGVDLVIERTKDGKIPLLTTLASNEAAPKTPQKSTTPAKLGELDFTAPLAIEAVRLSHVRAKIRDAFVSPPVEGTVTMSVRVNNVRGQNAPTKFELDVWSDPALNSLRVNGEGTGDGRNVQASMNLTMRGFHPKPLAGYLEPMGIRPIGSNIDADLHFALKMQALPDPSIGSAGSMTIDGIDLSCDQRPVAGLSKVQVDIAELVPTAMTVSRVLIEGGSLHAVRGRSGALQIAGLEFSAAQDQPTAPPPADRVAPSTASTDPPTTKPAPAFRLSVAEVAIRHMSAQLRDLAVSPVNELSAVLNDFTAKSDSPASTDVTQAKITLNGVAAVPGVIEAIQFDGSTKPFTPEKTIDLKFAATGVRPDALRQYLAAAGIESSLQSGRFEGQLGAVLHPQPAPKADLHISNVRFVDTGGELVALDRVDVTGVGNDEQTGTLKIASAELKGPVLNITRQADGRFAAGGLRFGGAVAPAIAPAAAERAPASNPSNKTPVGPSPIAALPRIEIGHLAWTGVKVNLRDEQIQPASALSIDDAGFEAKDIVFDLSSNEVSKDGSLRAWITAPQLAKQIGLEGKVRSGRGTLTTELALRGSQLNTSLLASYLKPFGVEPTLRDGGFQIDVKASLAEQSGRQLGASVELSNGQLREANVELAGVDTVKVQNLSAGPQGVQVDSIQVIRPRAMVAREADGAITAMGVRVALPAPATQPTPVAAAPPVAAPPATAPTAEPARASSLAASLKSFKIENARIDWSDHATREPVHTVAYAEAMVDNLIVGKPAPPAKFQATLTVDSALGEMAVAGEVEPTIDAPALRATIHARGIRAGAVAPYFPPGTELSTKAGEFKASIEARASRNAAGGKLARLVIDNIDWRDANSAEPLLSIDSIKAIASRIDPAGNVIAVDEVSLAGLETGAQLNADGSASALGLTIHPIAAGTGPTTQPAKAAAAPTTEPIVNSTTAPPEDVARLVAQARRPLPMITLGKLDINLRRVTVRNLAEPASVPLALDNLRLHNLEPIEMGGPQADSRPPVQLELTGKLAPIVGDIALRATLTPLANEPAGTITLNVSGIRGEGITELMPALRDKIDGSRLTDGQFHTEAQIHLKFQRRGPSDFNLSRGFSLEVAVNDVAFTQADTRFVGLESIRADQVHVEPKTGNVIVKSLEISKPEAFAYRDTDGIHALGLIILTPPPTTQPAAEPTTEPAPSVATSEPEPRSVPSSEIRVDRLTINGIDVRIEDRSVTPQLVVPLNNLDVEVRGLTTLALSEPKTIRFAFLLNSGKVPVPVHQKGGGIIGAVGGGEKDGATSTTRPTEERDLFSQIAAAGRMTVYPQPRGYVRTAINGVELAALEGEAKQAGVNLTQGVFDGTVDLRFRDDGSLQTKSKFVITDLSLSEGENGWVSKHLALPAPLDVVITSLQDADGSITVPLSPTLKEDQISGSALAAESVGALSSVIATAVANAPVKVVGGVGDVIGLGALAGGNKGKSNEPQPVVIQFAPGGTDLDATAQGQLNALLERARRDDNMQLTIRHELGGGDVPVVAQRANPSPEDSMAMAASLRKRKLELAEQRSRLAGDARAQLASVGAGQSETTVTLLRSLDRRIADIELSLDELYDLLKPGADRQAPRRTRAGCIQIGRARVDAVAAAIQASDLKDATQRVREASVQFNPSDSAEDGGRIIITPIIKKKG